MLKAVFTIEEALGRCNFVDQQVDLAVSGGADSVALALLARAGGRSGTIHHVDHQLRPTSADDAQLVRRLARELGFEFRLHLVEIDSSANLEARARAARRTVLPDGVLTGHSMDDLAETVLINLLRGAGVDGLSPMVHDPSKPLIELRRSELLEIVIGAHREFVVDSTNSDTSLLRNRIRLETMPMLCELAQRDLVPVIARQAHLMGEERQWLNELVAPDLSRAIGDIDCRELGTWPLARLRRWLRTHLAGIDEGDGVHPPSAAELDRVVDVVMGRAVATEISGARRVSRHGQHLQIT
jgi:tRNA(Ile)-lysidine synthase